MRGLSRGFVFVLESLVHTIPVLFFFSYRSLGPDIANLTRFIYKFDSTSLAMGPANQCRNVKMNFKYMLKLSRELYRRSPLMGPVMDRNSDFKH